MDNNFLIIKEDKNFSSPIAVLFYEYYSDVQSLNYYLKENTNLLQCIVSNSNKIENALALGSSQKPALYEYADGFDTLRFLLELH